MLYAVVTAMAFMASCYLLFRRANAMAPDITSPVRLRRWTAAFFMVFVLNHVWFLPTLFLTSSDDALMFNLVGVLLDCMTFFPLAIIVLLVMLQDRRRPLWPVAVMVTPLVVGMVLSVINRSLTLLPILSVYLLLMSIGLVIYMVRSLRQYGRWLRDNFADLEHKEVWESFVVLAIMLLVFGIYALSDRGIVFEYVLQVAVVVLIYYLLWRVETLPQLENTTMEQASSPLAPETAQAIDLPLATEGTHEPDFPTQAQQPLAIPANIEQLLAERCVDTKLYLQHDLTVFQLARAVGINRLYLSHYFSRQGMTYNAYINDLRINHFISLYREANAAGQSITAQELARDSGYRSYSTFSLAFKQRMGQSVTAWMRETAK